MEKRKDIVYEEYMHGAKLWICDKPNTNDAVIDIVVIGMDDRSIVVPLDKDKLLEIYSKIGEMIEEVKRP